MLLLTKLFTLLYNALASAQLKDFLNTAPAFD